MAAGHIPDGELIRGVEADEIAGADDVGGGGRRAHPCGEGDDSGAAICMVSMPTKPSGSKAEDCKKRHWCIGCSTY